jgi:hypothetical protein
MGPTHTTSSPALPPKVKYEPPRLPPKPSEYMSTACISTIPYNIPNVDPVHKNEQGYIFVYHEKMYNLRIITRLFI